MGKATRLTDEQISEALSGLSGWILVDGKLHREFKFGDFVEACCVTDPANWTAGGTLYSAYERWAAASGDTPIERKRFINYLVQRHGLTRKRFGRARGVSGIELKPIPKEPEPASEEPY